MHDPQPPPLDSAPEDNFALLRSHLMEGSFASSLLAAYTTADPAKRTQALDALLNTRLEEGRRAHEDSAPQGA